MRRHTTLVSLIQQIFIEYLIFAGNLPYIEAVMMNKKHLLTTSFLGLFIQVYINPFIYCLGLEYSARL